MLKYLLSAAMLAATTSMAAATCNTAALKGNWVIIVPEAICVAKVAANGKVTGSCRDGSLKLDRNCKVTGSLYGYKVTGRTDNQADSKVKPTLIIGDAAGTLGIMAYRQ